MKMDMAMRGPMFNILRPTGDRRIRVSMAVRYRSGSLFFVHGREGRSGMGCCIGARGEERRGREGMRRDEDRWRLGEGEEWDWLDAGVACTAGARQGGVRRLRMRAS